MAMGSAEYPLSPDGGTARVSGDFFSPNSLARVSGLSRRPDLNGTVVKLLELDDSPGCEARWAVLPVDGGKGLRVKPCNLTPVRPAEDEQEAEAEVVEPTAAEPTAGETAEVSEEPTAEGTAIVPTPTPTAVAPPPPPIAQWLAQLVNCFCPMATEAGPTRGVVAATATESAATVAKPLESSAAELSREAANRELTRRIGG